jgi:hypothetical protein
VVEKKGRKMHTSSLIFAELFEMQTILENYGYNPTDAYIFYREGIGPYELEYRIKTTQPGEIGSIEYTHNIKKK